jgi:hypothetical protein
MTAVSSRATPAALLAALTLFGLAPASASAKEASLGGYDVISRPGRTVTLRAKLESKGMMGINPDVEDEPLDFFLVRQDGKDLESPKFVGTGETDDDGLAKLEWKPASAGQYELEVRVRRGSEYVAMPAPVLVSIPPKGRTILLIQIDGTVSTATNLKMFRGTENAEIPAVEGARQTLETLANHYQLVYLTDLERAFTDKFKTWLELREMPRAPILFWDLFERSLSHATYMKKLVAKLHQDFGEATLGIGGVEADGKAFVQNGLVGVVITKSPDDLPLEVIPAARWAEVLQHVTLAHKSNGLLKIASGPDAPQRQEALDALSLMGRAGIGYVHRFRASTDPNLASTAELLTGKLRACEAFYRSLQFKTANQALHSLLAAWKYGEQTVAVRVYKEREVGLAEPLPTFDRVELVSRHEPEPAKVVFKVKLLRTGGDASERELVFQRQEDKTWRLHVEEF